MQDESQGSRERPVMNAKSVGTTGRQKTSDEHVIRVFDDPAAIDAEQWNTLLEAQAASIPFMRHEYLLALHRSTSASTATGWTPQFLAVTQGDTLVAACTCT